MGDSFHQKRLGKRGEDAAAAYLAKNGYRIAARNYRNREGEVDLVAWDGEFLVFIEVKSRASARFGSGIESVTPRKQEKIIRTAECYMAEFFPDAFPACRFDVAEVDLYRGEVVAVNVIKDAFTA